MSRLPPSMTPDQAHGLRQMFGRQRPVRQPAVLVPLLHNPHVGFAGVVMERLAAAWALQGLRTLVVDAGPRARDPGELAAVDLAACIERLDAHTSYLPARGLPGRHADEHGRFARLASSLRDAAPTADVLLVHGSAAELLRMAEGSERPIVMLGLRPESVTEAYAGCKQWSQRLGLGGWQALAVADCAPRAAATLLHRLAGCTQRFLSTRPDATAQVNPSESAVQRPDAALLRVALAQRPTTRSQAVRADRPRADGTAPSLLLA